MGRQPALNAVLRYDEDALSDRLAALERWERDAFALACAQRLLALYVRYTDVTHEGDGAFAKKAAEDLWRSLQVRGLARDELERIESRLEDLVPNGQAVDVSAWHWYAMGAMAALAYAAQSQFTDGVDPALCAAREAHEAALLYVRQRDRLNLHSVAEVVALDDDPVIHDELARQERDLDLLDADTPREEKLHEVRRLAEEARLFDLDSVF